MNRPKTSQIVIDEFSKIIDQQDLKGLEKYNKTIDEAVDEDYDWKTMALEEAADLQKYLVREIKVLKKLLKEERARVKQLEIWHNRNINFE